MLFLPGLERLWILWIIMKTLTGWWPRSTTIMTIMKYDLVSSVIFEVSSKTCVSWNWSASFQNQLCWRWCHFASLWKRCCSRKLSARTYLDIDLGCSPTRSENIELGSKKCENLSLWSLLLEWKYIPTSIWVARNRNSMSIIQSKTYCWWKKPMEPAKHGGFVSILYGLGSQITSFR